MSRSCGSQIRAPQMKTLPLFRQKSIAQSANGVDERRRRTELLSQSADMRVHRTRINVRVVFPHIVQQLLT